MYLQAQEEFIAEILTTECTRGKFILTKYEVPTHSIRWDKREK